MSEGIILIAIMFGLIALGVPITFSLGLSSLVFFIIQDIPLSTFVQKIAMSVDSFPLLALPFYILAGNLMNNGGITRRLFAFAKSLLGSLRGGLCYVAIAANVIFSAISGSALANAAGLGTISIKAMEEEKYDKDFSAALVSTASVLGPIIPPSVIMIVYGVTAGVSIQRMFMGGLVPGILYALMMVAMCAWYGKKKNFPKGEPFKAKALWVSFKDAIWALLAPVIILGGVFTGIFTATESGAIACLYVLFVGIFIYKDLSIKDLGQVIIDCAKTTGTILLIAATAAVLGFCLTYARVPQALANALVGVIHNKYILLGIFAIVYLFLGCIMEASAIVITTVPIFMPVCHAMGIDLIYFGVFVGILMSIGTITPPVGTVMFVICKNSQITVEKFAKIMLPWFGMIVLFVVILILLPQLVTFLPTLIYG